MRQNDEKNRTLPASWNFGGAYGVPCFCPHCRQGEGEAPIGSRSLDGSRTWAPSSQSRSSLFPWLREREAGKVPSGWQSLFAACGHQDMLVPGKIRKPVNLLLFWNFYSFAVMDATG